MKEEEGKVDEAASLIQEVQAGPLQLWRVGSWGLLGFVWCLLLHPGQAWSPFYTPTHSHTQTDTHTHTHTCTFASTAKQAERNKHRERETDRQTDTKTNTNTRIHNAARLHLQVLMPKSGSHNKPSRCFTHQRGTAQAPAEGFGGGTFGFWSRFGVDGLVTFMLCYRWSPSELWNGARRQLLWLKLGGRGYSVQGFHGYRAYDPSMRTVVNVVP